MKNPFKTFWNWLFPYRNFPETLAEELSVISPFTVDEIQPILDEIVVYPLKACPKILKHGKNIKTSCSKVFIQI